MSAPIDDTPFVVIDGSKVEHVHGGVAVLDYGTLRDTSPNNQEAVLDLRHLATVTFEASREQVVADVIDDCNDWLGEHGFCPECGGTGDFHVERCHECRGTGLFTVPEHPDPDAAYEAARDARLGL